MIYELLSTETQAKNELDASKYKDTLIELFEYAQEMSTDGNIKLEDFHRLCETVIVNIVLLDKSLTRMDAIAISKYMQALAEEREFFNDIFKFWMVSLSKRVCNEFEIGTDEQYEMLHKQLYKS